MAAQGETITAEAPQSWTGTVYQADIGWGLSPAFLAIEGAEHWMRTRRETVARALHAGHRVSVLEIGPLQRVRRVSHTERADARARLGAQEAA